MHNYFWILSLVFLVACQAENSSGNQANASHSDPNQVLNNQEAEKSVCYQTAIPDIMEQLKLYWDEQEIKGSGNRQYTRWKIIADINLKGKKIDDSTYRVNITAVIPKPDGSNKTASFEENWIWRKNHWFVKQRNFGDQIVADCAWYQVNCAGQTSPQLYDAIYAFKDGFAVVERANVQGLVDTEFKLRLPLAYRDMSAVNEGTISYQDTTTQRYGVMRVDGSVIVPPKYMKTHPANEGLIAFLDPQAAAWGFMNVEGKVVIQPNFSSINVFDGVQEMHPFNEGLANVLPKGQENYGYIDKTGRFVIAPRFAQADGFQKGQARIYDNDKQAWYWIDRSGQCVKDCP
jgi:hypothetical protein